MQRWRRVKERERGRAVVYAGCLCKETVGIDTWETDTGRTNTDRQTDVSRWRLTESDGGEREKEGEKPTDKQTVKVTGERVRQPWGAYGGQEWSKALNSIVVIQLAFFWVLWMVILADSLQTRLIAKSWPRRLQGDPGTVGVWVSTGEVYAD